MGQRAGGWRAAVPLVAAAAGLLIAAGANSVGADARAGTRTDLPDLIGGQERIVASRTQQVARLRKDVEARNRAAGGSVGVAQAAVDAVARAAGFDPVHGPGVTVTLRDSPRDAADPGLPAGTSPDDLVVHQQDLQGVVNALWAGGARAVAVMDQRLVNTSAVRCAGNVLVLNGRTYAPPFVVRAVGDPSRLEAALSAEPSVRIFRNYVARIGLGYHETSGAVALPGFQGSVAVGAARPLRPGDRTMGPYPQSTPASPPTASPRLR